MEATTTKRRRTRHPMSYYREMVQDMDDRQKLELVSILIESVKPAVAKTEADDEEYSLRPFTMEELNARIDQAEAEIAAGLGIDDEDVWHELEEEFAREDAEEDARQLAAYHKEEQLAWQAGRTVSQSDVDAFGGIEKCFAAEPIPDGVWARMQGKTYKENPYIGRDDLRHVRALHWDYDNQMHVGEMVVNAQIADRVVTILRQLFDAKYPIQRMLLPDVYDADDETQMRDNNSSCFCYRAVAGTTVLSKHARGLAVDINTLYNPYYKDRDDGTRYIQPATAADYCDRTWDFPYKIDHDDLCFRLFTAAGFEWGGDWTSCKDYQHFELIEE